MYYRVFYTCTTCSIKDRVCNPKTERVHPNGAMPAAAAVVLHEDGQEDKKRAEMYTREDENSAPLAAGLASADKMRRWADGRATEGAIIAPRCGLLP